MSEFRFQPGLDTLLTTHRAWLRRRRVALVSHAAAVDRNGTHGASRLLDSGLARSLELWGPEHGFLGTAGAGERVAHARHPVWGLPMRSLYGDQRRPTPEMLRAVDLIVVDLQDLAVRCYTYVSTLRAVLEAAAEQGTTVVVADRPVPFPDTVDGPMLDPAQASFVGAIPAPLVYGMTPGETALWLQRTLKLDLDLRVAAMRGYTRSPFRGSDWPPWMPPSPGIATWESAWCYPATVMTEALPALDCARASRLPFQSLAATWLDAEACTAAMRAAALPGVAFHADTRVITPADAGARSAGAIRMAITDPARYRPVQTAVTLLRVLMDVHGRRRVWGPGSRPAFFDNLFGTDNVRKALRSGAPATTVTAPWATASATFRRARQAALLYATNPERRPWSRR